MAKGWHPYHERVLAEFRAAGEHGTTPAAVARRLGTTRRTVVQAVYELRHVHGCRIVRRDALVLRKGPT